MVVTFFFFWGGVFSIVFCVVKEAFNVVFLMVFNGFEEYFWWPLLLFSVYGRGSGVFLCMFFLSP